MFSKNDCLCQRLFKILTDIKVQISLTKNIYIYIYIYLCAPDCCFNNRPPARVNEQT